MAKMSDIEWELQQDIRWRKNIGQQAKYKKNGVRSKKCSLPSDHLTKKQLKGLSGEVMSYNLNKPMTWKVFKFMPQDLQKQYLEKLRDEHCANQKSVALMLGIHPNSFSTYCKSRSINVFPRSTYRSFESESKWQAFLNGESTTDSKQPVEHEDITPPPENTDVPVIPNPGNNPPMKCASSIHLNFSGKFDWYSFMQQITRHIKDGEEVEISVRCRVTPDSYEPMSKEDEAVIALGE